MPLNELRRVVIGLVHEASVADARKAIMALKRVRVDRMVEPRFTDARENPIPFVEGLIDRVRAAIQRALHGRVVDAYGPHTLDKVPKELTTLEDVRVADVVTIQSWISRKGLLGVVEGGASSTEPIQVVLLRDGRPVVVDGNHRAAGALLLGRATLRARVLREP